MTLDRFYLESWLEGLKRYCVALDFPVFCTGFKPVDSRGRGNVSDYDYTVPVGGVLVRPKDVAFGNDDGVIVIPLKY